MRPRSAHRGDHRVPGARSRAGARRDPRVASARDRCGRARGARCPGAPARGARDRLELLPQRSARAPDSSGAGGACTSARAGAPRHGAPHRRGGETRRDCREPPVVLGRQPSRGAAAPVRRRRARRTADRHRGTQGVLELAPALLESVLRHDQGSAEQRRLDRRSRDESTRGGARGPSGDRDRARAASARRGTAGLRRGHQEPDR